MKKVEQLNLKADDNKDLLLETLEIVYKEATDDIKKGRFIIETVDQHLKRLWNKPKKALKNNP